MKIYRPLMGIALLATILAGPAHADWLVTLDGQRIETRGPWEVQGRRILFTNNQGTLSVLRASEIDLGASEDATKKANQAPSAKPTSATSKPTKAALILDQGSVQRHRPVVEPDSVDGKEGGDPEEAPAGRVEIVDWKESQQPGDELSLSGTIRNNSEFFATELKVMVTVYDETGEPAAAEKQATLGRTTLGKDASTTFNIDFPDLFITNGATFKITNRGFLSGQQERKETVEDESKR